MEMEVVVNRSAYCKLVLHAAKYQECAVNGLLLAEEVKVKDTKTLKFVDAVPLFHVSLGLAPALEVALTQVELYARSAGLVIAGYYQANAHITDNKLNHTSNTIGRKILEHFSDALIFMINNTRLSYDASSEIYNVYHYKDSSWKQLHQSTVDEDTLAMTAVMLQSHAHRKLIDFDNHLDDISLDWCNPDIDDMLGKCV